MWRHPGWSSWTGPLDHLFSFFKVSIIITAPLTHRTCPAEAWWAADLRRAAEVRSSRRPKRCAEGWSTGPLLSRPPPIADLTRAMCVSGDSVHFRSGPPPTTEVVQWTRHLVQGGPLPAERPTGSQHENRCVLTKMAPPPTTKAERDLLTDMQYKRRVLADRVVLEPARERWQIRQVMMVHDSP